jgi:hypothetical protein
MAESEGVAWRGVECNGAKGERGHLERRWSRIEEDCEASGLEDDVDEDAGSDFDGRSISHPSPSVEVQLDPTAGQARLLVWGLCAALFVQAPSKLKFILLFDWQTLSSSMCGHNI